MKKPNSIVISGTGRYVPEKILTNHDLAKFVDTSDEWIFTSLTVCIISYLVTFVKNFF